MSEFVAKNSKHPVGSGHSRVLTVAFLGLLAGLQLIDPSVASISLVKASRALGMQGATLDMAASISTLVQAATVLLMGFLADRFGRRRVLLASLLLAVVGDLLTVVTPTVSLYLLGRAITGMALGSVLAASFAYVRFVSPPERLSRSLGLWNLMTVLGFILGSLAGGSLANAGWRWAMGLIPVLCSLSALLVPFLLPAVPPNPTLRADVPGLVSIAIAMVLFLTGVSRATDGLQSPTFVLPTLAGLLMFGVHYVVERRSQRPIFPPSLYGRGFFAAAIVSGIAWNLAQAVVQLQTSNFWQVVQRFSTSKVALAQLPIVVTFGLGGIVAGALLRPGRRTTQLMTAGTFALVVGLALLGGIQADSAFITLVPALLLVGTGLAFVAVPQSALFLQEAPVDAVGAVTAFRTTTGQLGFALGFAASGTMVSSFGFASLRQRLLENGHHLAEIPQIEQQVRLFLRTGHLPSGSSGAQLLELIRAAYASGLSVTMVGVALITALLGFITLLLLVIGQQQQLLKPLKH